MRSLRRNLILGTTIGSAVVLLAAGVLLYVLVRTGLVDQFDRGLVDKARLLASTVEQKRGRIDLDFDELDMREFDASDGRGFLQLRLADGSTLFRSQSLGKADLPCVAEPIESPAYRWATLPDGRAGRAVSFTFVPRVDDGGRNPGDPATRPRAPRVVTLVLARDTAPVDATLGPLKALLVSVGLVSVAVSSGVLWLVVRRSLRPLDRVAAQIGRLGHSDLSERIDVENAPRELQPVVQRLNELLARLEGAFQRERSFTADVAHELRTPLAGLRATMEIALSRTRRGEEYEDAIGDCLRIAMQMQAMVENLLSLARLEAGRVEVHPERVHLNDLVRASWAQLAKPAEARRLDVQWALGQDVCATTDPTLIGLVVRNLLENAVAYADEGGSVAIETLAGDGGATVGIGNTGSKVPQDQVGRLFDRFWRGDEARSAAGIHCGLGLPLVERIMAVLGGRVEVRSSAGGRFEITVSLPR